MISGFEPYTLEAWSDVCGLIVRGRPHKASIHPQQGMVRRRGGWNIVFSKAAGGVLIGSVFLAASCNAMAVAIPKIVPDTYDFNVAKLKSSQAVDLSPIRNINQSFNKLFDSMRAGQVLIPSENVRILAQKALQSQKEVVDINSWARNLANDIKAAND